MPHKLLGICLFFGLQFSFAQQNNYVEAYPLKGQGTYAFLRSFGVLTDCNLSYFYQINQIKGKRGLRAAYKYKLPILKYTYNGRSIRSTLGITDRPLAERIQQFNELLTEKRIKDGDYRIDKILWVPYHLITCPQEQASPLIASQSSPFSTISSNPNKPLRGIYEIFGKKHSRVPLLGNALKGKVYYLVSGHGGYDSGATGKYYRKMICEDEYAYDITLRLAKNLLSHGATVYIITRDPNDGIRQGEILPCDTDERCWGDLEIPSVQSERLFQRSDAVNALYEKNKRVPYQRTLILHIDSGSKKKSTDMYFYHQHNNVTSYRLAKQLQETIRQKYDEVRKGRGYSGKVSPRDLHMLRELSPVSVFIELGNIKNPSDQARFVKEGNRQLVANWLAEGLMLDVKTKLGR